MRAMILAAGLGTRLRPLTQTTPKALLLVNKQPLIAYSLRLLRKYGIKEVLINLHHLGELIEKELGDGTKFGMKISYSWEPQVLGTGGGVKKASLFFEGEPFLVVNSDILIDVDLGDLIRRHRRKKGLATMVVRPRENDCAYTPIFLGLGDRVLAIGSGEASKKTTRAVTFTGIQVLDPRFLDYLPDGREACIIRQGYLPALESGEKIYGYIYEGYWNDLGTLDRLRQAEQDLASRKASLSYL